MVGPIGVPVPLVLEPHAAGVDESGEEVFGGGAGSGRRSRRTGGQIDVIHDLERTSDG